MWGEGVLMCSSTREEEKELKQQLAQEDIRAAARLGVIHGVTTNPTLISREKGDFSAIIREIASLVDGPVFAEVLSTEAEGMIREGRELAAVDPAVCVKIPMTEDGLTAVSVLSKEGIRVCSLARIDHFDNGTVVFREADR